MNWQFDPPAEPGPSAPAPEPPAPGPAPLPEAGERPAARPDVDALFEQARATSGRHAGRRPWSPDPDGLWSTTLQWVVAAAVTLFLAWATYAHGGWVLILSSFDLGVHEFGHLVFFWAPTLWVQAAGSFMQVFLPLALLAYFLWRRDRFAAILMIAWAAESLNDVSVYIGDAQRMQLTLFNDDGSGSGHDWHNILTELHQLPRTDDLAHFVRTVSFLLFLTALGLSLYWLVQSRRAQRAP